MMKFRIFQRSKNSIDEGKEKLNLLVQDATTFIGEVEKGNLTADLSPVLTETPLGNSLASLKNHLSKIEEENQKRNWSNVGLAKFSDILRNKQSLSLKELGNDILTNLVKYVNANQGAIFILENKDLNDEHLQMIASYAYDRRKYINKRIELGEGLAGQCVLERESILLKEVPEDYISITSGLGDAPPRCVFISPLLINDSIFGVVELATLSVFESHHISFIEKLSENIASSIKNVKDAERNLSLLNTSQQQTEELRAQEEEMRQNVEEMQATQEEMQRKSDELSRTSSEMTGVIDGINATMATIEFTPDGSIIKANDNFLQSMKYSMAEIKGKHHVMFAPKEVKESAEYKTFWKRLAAGEAIKGVFKRVSSTGSVVWLNAIYNPIINPTGEVSKVMKFAIDVTEQQEMVAESKGILAGINSTMATVEFVPDGTIIKANDNFLAAMKYTATEIKGKHHKIFAPKDVVESIEYETFWKRLAAGESMKGIFKRISSSGNTVWLDAIYNPIYNSSGKVIKIIKFATDVTEQQENLAESKGVLNGIDATMATIVFKPNGTIVSANNNFLKLMKYSLDEIEGKHHRIFTPTDVLESEEYKTFWSSLAAGKPRTGIFKRKAFDGSTVWLNAIYNPITNANGEITKVVKFASDVTREQELLNKSTLVL